MSDVLDTASRVWRRLDYGERMYLIVVGGCLLMWAYEWLTSSRSSHQRTRAIDHQRITLDEHKLKHLEDGGEIRLPRWHGGEIALSAEEVVLTVNDEDTVDVEAVDDSDQEDVDEDA